MAVESTQAKLVQFLREELAIPAAAIALAERQQDYPSSHLPMVLWQYGLITLEQLDRVFDWLETA